MSSLFGNPEFTRNVRIQLRRGRVIATMVICAAISITAWASIVDPKSGPETIDGLTGPGAVFALMLYTQISILLIGGGLYCLLSVSREKELNSFDYQRVTRLTSLELTIGKLFGAPVLAYFAALCFVPVALIGASRGHVPISTVAEAYVLILLGSIAFHALALLLSVFLGRGGTVLAILFFLLVVGFTSVDIYQPIAVGAKPTWTVHTLNPYSVGDLIAKPPPHIESIASQRFWEGRWRDKFLGHVISHGIVLVGIYLTFAAWFLLGIVRNLKRDPSIYEIFSPRQMLLAVLYVNLLLVAFFPWAEEFLEYTVRLGDRMYTVRNATTSEVLQSYFSVSLCMFVILALILLRNRERVRRRVARLGSRAAGWWAALWPAPYLAAGIALVGAAVIGFISHYHGSAQWDVRLGIYYVVFMIVWLARDAIYLQWMSLRRSRRPLAVAALYLLIFYVCATTLLFALHFAGTAQVYVMSAAILPWSALSINLHAWQTHGRLFIGALLLQAAAALIFAWLHRQRLRELEPKVQSPVLARTEAQQA